MCGKFRESWNEEAKRVVRFVSPSSKNVRIQREPESKWKGYVWNCLIFTVEREVISTSSRLQLLQSMAIMEKCPPYLSGHELLETTLSLKKASSWMQILNFQWLAKMKKGPREAVIVQVFFILLSISISKQLLDHCDFTMCKVFPLCLSLSIFLTLTQVHACLSLSLSSYMERAFEGTFGLTRITLFLHQVGAQYETLQKYFSHPSLVIYFFPTSTIKLKLKLQIDERLLILTRLDQSLWLANQKHGAAVSSYLLHSSLEGVRLYCAFYQPQ